MPDKKTITAIEGIRVGHFTNAKNYRGCTVVRFPKDGAVAGVDVRGSAPGTREIALLSPVNLAERVHALVFAGGSAFGLDAAGGVMKCLEEDGAGFDTGLNIRVPIVPATIIYDLKVGDSKIRPEASWGYRACRAASNKPVEQGNIGAGLGATVGKIVGMKSAMKGGLGSSVIDLPNGAMVAALMIVNTIGDVYDVEGGEIIAGARGTKCGSFINAAKLLREKGRGTVFSGTNTAIGLVATNVVFTKTELTKIAQMAHDGIARVIRPSHTMYDGDVIFAASVPPPTGKGSRKAAGRGAGKGKPSITAVGSAAADAVAQAIVNAIRNAKSIPGYPSCRDWSPAQSPR